MKTHKRKTVYVVVIDDCGDTEMKAFATREDAARYGEDICSPYEIWPQQGWNGEVLRCVPRYYAVVGMFGGQCRASENAVAIPLGDPLPPSRSGIDDSYEGKPGELVNAGAWAVSYVSMAEACQLAQAARDAELAAREAQGAPDPLPRAWLPTGAVPPYGYVAKDLAAQRDFYEGQIERACACCSPVVAQQLREHVAQLDAAISVIEGSNPWGFPRSWRDVGERSG